MSEVNDSVEDASEKTTKGINKHKKKVLKKKRMLLQVRTNTCQ
ncbi:MAG TPA: hypothetical protein VJR94_12710 [Candidatus Nitrosocosmicus sp.]|nr:hypothetical protein [Candidatus Nitrosocosmicus sp.]